MWFEKQIDQTKWFSLTWTQPTTMSIKKDSLASQLSSVHLHIQKILFRILQLVEVYIKWGVKDTESLRKKFNIAYFVAK